MSKKTGLPKGVRWHQGVLRYQRPHVFEGRMMRFDCAPNTPEFWQAYACFEAGQLPEGYVERRPAKTKPGGSGSAKGSLQWGIDLYLADAEREQKWIARVRRKKEKVLRAFAASTSAADNTPRGQWAISDFEPSNVKSYLAECEKAGGVGRYNLHFDAIKPLFTWFNATEHNGKRILATLNPLHGMQRKDYRYTEADVAEAEANPDLPMILKGRKRIPFAWKQEHFDAFRARWPVGAADTEFFGRPRLVLEMADALWIRRVDLTLLGPAHLKRDADGDEVWDFTEFKGSRSQDPKQHRLKTKYMPELMEALAGYLAAYKRHPVQSIEAQKAFLTYVGNGPNRGKTMTGKREVAYYSKGEDDIDARWFNKHFRKWCDAAGLPKAATLHGIRRGAGVIEIEHEDGADFNEVRAKLRHTHHQMTAKYVRTAVDNKLANNLNRRRHARRQAAKGRPQLKVVGQ